VPDLTITGNIQVEGVAYENGVVIASTLYAEGDPAEFSVLGETTSDASGNWSLTIVGRTTPIAVMVQVPSDRPKVFAPVFDGYVLSWDFDGVAPPAPEPPPTPPPDPEPPEPPPVPGVPDPLPVDMWTPEFTQVECWLHDEGSHVIVENKISAWLNRRPSETTTVPASYVREQTDPSKRPTWDYLNLRPVVVFDGVDDFLPALGAKGIARDRPFGHDTLTFYVVAKHAAVPTTKKVAVATDALFTWTNPTLGTRPEFRIGAGSPSGKSFAEYAVYAPGDAPGDMTAVSTTADITAGWHIRTIVVDRFAGEIRHYLDGADTPEVEVLPNSYSAYQGLWEVYLGAAEDETDHAAVSIAEFLAMPGEETRDHQRRIEGYLAWKWGLEDNLAVGHPFKSNYPVIPTTWNYAAVDKDLWYDASDADTVILDGASNVAEWRDKSGLNKHLTQPTAALRPTWDQFTGKIGIAEGRYLAGQGDFSLMEEKNYTLYLVTKIADLQRSNYNVIFSTLLDYSNEGEATFGYYEVEGRIQHRFSLRESTSTTSASGAAGGFGNHPRAGDSAVTVWTAIEGPPADEPVSVELRSGYGAIQDVLNGAGSSRIGYIIWGGSNFGWLAVGGMARANTTAFPSIIYPMIGEVMEIIAFPTHHTPDQRQRVEATLAWKWGFPDMLSYDHTYRWAPPYQEDVDAATDANYANVSLLLNFNDPSYAPTAPLPNFSDLVGMQHFNDAGPLNLTIQRFRSSIINDYKNYTTGWRTPTYLTGASWSYLATIDSPGFAFGTAPFAIEFQHRGVGAAGTRRALLGNAAEGTSNTAWEVGVSSTGAVYFRTANTVLLEGTAPAGVRTLGWVHVAVTFDGTTYRIFLQGKLAASSTTAVNLSSELGIWIGRSRGATPYGATPVMRYLRITKGIARYTAEFDPPNRPHPDTGP
jgi:hypothetical protein